MVSLLGSLNIAREGMTAQTAGLAVTGNNVTNANTPGYVRQSVQFDETVPGGVDVSGIGRSFDQFTFARVLDATGRQGAASARSDALSQLEQVVAPSAGGIPGQLNSLFSSFATLSSTPNDPTARQQVLASASSLAQSVSASAAGLQSLRTALTTQASGVVDQLNTNLSHIADLNSQIAQATATGGDASALQDQRDGLVKMVVGQIGGSTVTDKTGAVTILAAGTSLVSGGQAAKVSVGVGPGGDLAFKVSHGGSATDITGGVSSGKLGGIRQARDIDVPKAQAQLDQFAYDLSNTVNAVHASGVGLDGVGGRPLFTPPTAVAGAAYSMSVDASVAGQPDHVAAAAAASDLPAGNDVATSLSQLASAPMQGGTASPADRLSSLSGAVGMLKQSADEELSLRNDTAAQAQTANDSVSGVSIDEEMTNLTTYQRAYEASTKFAQTIDQLLDTLKDL